MGQYYRPVLIDEDGNMSTLYSFDYDNGLKLMEHSYIGNEFMAAVMNAIHDNPCKVWWLGDYATISDFKNKERRLLSKDRKKAFSGTKNVKYYRTWDWESDTYLVNLDRHCYILLAKYDEKKWQIHPLSLLTAVGNGQGGGDYHSDIGKDDVGTWAGDELMVTKTKPENLLDVTDSYYFAEK